MTWNTSLMAGPCQVPIFGDPLPDGRGGTYLPLVGYRPGVVFVLPSSAVTPELQPYAGPLPAGVPVLGGETCTALTFTDEAAAKGPLAAYWSGP